jgi:transcriptional regulator with GAF, ATPase, and Fis domain
VSLADTLVADFDVLDFLGMLTERAVELLDVDAAAVMLSDQRGGLRPAAGSSEHAEVIEVFAALTHESPCVDCIETGRPVSTADLSADVERWPGFAPVAVSKGFRAACAVPLRLREDVIGALTLLGTRPIAIDEASVKLGQAFADIATIGILQQRAINHDEIVSEQLQAALHHRVIVEQAKGVLTEASGVDMHEAYLLLRNYARAHGQRLTEVARDIATAKLNPSDLQAEPTDVS